MTRSAAGVHREPAAPRAVPVTGLVAATYNIHRCVGTDGRYSPARVADVIGELGADIVGLQEVDRSLSAGRGLDQLSYLASRLGYHSAAGSGPGTDVASGRCGRCQNALLSRWPILNWRLINLTVPGREPRSAVDAEISLAGTRCGDAPSLRTVVTHFGLGAGERRRQLQALLTRLEERGDPAWPLLLMGDLNEWRRAGPVSRGLGAVLTCGRSVGSFPARLPLLPLDRICGRSMSMAAAPRRHVSKIAKVASDHLPVRATFTLGLDA